MSDLDPAWIRLKSYWRPEDNKERFARRLNVSRQTVTNWENGGTVGRDTLEKAVEVFGTSLDGLVYGEPSAEGPPARADVVRHIEWLADYARGEAVDWEPASLDEVPAQRVIREDEDGDVDPESRGGGRGGG